MLYKSTKIVIVYITVSNIVTKVIKTTYQICGPISFIYKAQVNHFSDAKIDFLMLAIPRIARDIVLIWR